MLKIQHLSTIYVIPVRSFAIEKSALLFYNKNIEIYIINSERSKS